jgi:hypothetical protein
MDADNVLPNPDQHAIEIAIAAVVSEPTLQERNSLTTIINVISDPTFTKRVRMITTPSGGTTPTIVDKSDDSSSANNEIIFQTASNKDGYIIHYKNQNSSIKEATFEATIDVSSPIYMVITGDSVQKLNAKPDLINNNGIYVEIHTIEHSNHPLYYVKHLKPTAP